MGSTLIQLPFFADDFSFSKLPSNLISLSFIYPRKLYHGKGCIWKWRIPIAGWKEVKGTFALCKCMWCHLSYRRGAIPALPPKDAVLKVLRTGALLEKIHTSNGNATHVSMVHIIINQCHYHVLGRMILVPITCQESYRIRSCMFVQAQ